MNHEFYEREDGLMHCKICGGAEGSLPTNCPGKRMAGEEQNAIYDGQLDYTDEMGWVVKRDGAWQLPPGTTLHAAMRELSQKLADEHGVFVVDISVDWVNISSSLEAKGMLTGLRIVSQSGATP